MLSRHETWQREQLTSQLSIFPEGQLCIEYEGRLVASSSSLILDFALYSQWHNWKEIADAGFIRNHNPEGNTLYGSKSWWTRTTEKCGSPAACMRLARSSPARRIS